MSTDISSLQTVYKGWDTYQSSIVNTIATLSPEQLAWRLAPHLRSAGEIAHHIAVASTGSMASWAKATVNLPAWWQPDSPKILSQLMPLSLLSG
jgi:hypothetical protein